MKNSIFAAIVLSAAVMASSSVPAAEECYTEALDLISMNLLEAAVLQLNQAIELDPHYEDALFARSSVLPHPARKPDRETSNKKDIPLIKALFGNTIDYTPFG